MKFQQILKCIARGEEVDLKEILPMLCTEKAGERAKVNLSLAQAYVSCRNFRKAKHFVQRAWVLSNFNENILPLYIHIHEVLDEPAQIAEAFKRVGMRKAKENKINEALNYFRKSLSVYAEPKYEDKSYIDFDINNKIEQLAAPYSFSPTLKDSFGPNGKIKVGYILSLYTIGPIVKLNVSFAKYHNKDIFDVIFYITDPKSCMVSRHDFIETIKTLKKWGCEVIFAPRVTTEFEKILYLGQEIYNARLDILITNIQCYDPYIYFLTALKPTPIIISLNHGRPYVYTSFLPDLHICWTKHSLMDSMGNCRLVKGGIEFPKIMSHSPYRKEDFSLKKDDIVLISTGRPHKFQNKTFWKEIANILRINSKLHYFAIGVKVKDIPFLKDIIDKNLIRRIHCLEWQRDCYELLYIGDIYLDTFPAGGGFSMYEAMSVGLPAVSFENNYMKQFDQGDWSPAYEYFSIPELVAERGNFKQFKRIIKKLIENMDYRQRIGKALKEKMLSHMGHPERMVRECEEIYMKVLREKLVERKKIGSLPGKVQEEHLENLINLVALQFKKGELTLASDNLKKVFKIGINLMKEWENLSLRIFISKGRVGLKNILKSKVPQPVKDSIKKILRKKHKIV